jgi:PelA/Pel-15E family pectate lyase
VRQKETIMRISSFSLAAGILWAVSFASAMASVVGTNPPSLPLTGQRVETLPKIQQTAWKEYLDKSKRQMLADKDSLSAERKASGAADFAVPAAGHDARSVPLDKETSWYAGAEATHIADVVLSFQTPAGGWSKNLDMSKTPRQPGQSYAYGPDQTARLITPGDFGTVSDSGWSYVGTIDNDATTTQIHFLAKVVAALGPTTLKAAPYRASFLRGLDYLLAAQYPNGGWPQVWPLEGGYHDGITYNDDAMIQVMELLQSAASGRDEFAFVPADVRKRADSSVQRAIQCILATQIVAGGKRTAWCQQHDPLTLQPASARNYEMPSQSAAESAKILLFLMELPHPTAAEVDAINRAGKWLTKVAISDFAFRPTPAGRDLVPSPGAPLLWARYYQIGTDRPLFGDRDKSIHDNVAEISTERRNGYSWYNSTPQEAVTQYAEWSKSHRVGVSAN